MTIKIILWLLVLIAVLLIINYKYCTSENFTSEIPKAEISSETSTQINNIDGYLNKKLHIMTTIGGREYMLASVKDTQCKNKHPKSINCMTNTLVLLEQEHASSIHSKEQLDNSDKEKICAFISKVKCERELIEKSKSETKMETTKSENTTCDKVPIECKVRFADNTSFELLKTSDENYKILGRVKMEDNIHVKGSMSAPYVVDATNYKTSYPMHACLDGGINATDSDPISTVEIIELPTQNNVVKYVFRIKTKIMLGNGYVYDKNGNIVYETKYLGVCKDDLCKLNGERNTKRVCLYDQESNPFVLQFTFKIHSH